MVEGDAEAREADAAPSTSHAPAKKRVVKVVTSQGVCLRNVSFKQDFCLVMWRLDFSQTFSLRKQI